MTRLFWQSLLGSALIASACRDVPASPHTDSEPLDEIRENVVTTVPIALASRSSLACDNPGAVGFTPFDPGPDWRALQAGSRDHQTGWGFAVADLSGDGVLDVFFPQFDQDNLLFGQVDGGFQDETARLPVESELGMSVAAFDAEGDGDLDLYVGQVGPNRLLLNDGAGNFHRAPDDGGAAGGPYYTQHVAVGDVNGDGAPDLFIANFVTDAAFGDPNALYLNRGDGTFEDISWMLEGPSRDWPTNAGGFFDADGDGDQDLYVVNDKELLGTHCVLLWNQDGTLVADDGSAGLDLSIDGMGLGLADLNDDDRPDIFVTGTNELSLMMSAPDGTWYDAARALGVWPQDPRITGWGPEFADLNNDGDLDLLVAFGVAYHLDGEISDLQNEPHEQSMGLWAGVQDGTFMEDSAFWGLDALGAYRGFVLADLNGDGAPDLFNRDTWSQPTISLGACNDDAWLTLALRAPGPNTYALGAVVEVFADGRRWEGVVRTATTNITVSGPPELHFGFGRVELLDEVRIHWPDGEESTLFDLSPRRRLIVTRLP